MLWFHRLCQGLLAQFLAQIVGDQWHMHVAHRPGIELFLQCQMNRSGVHQIGATDHIGDALVGIVHHHGQVVRPMSVRTTKHNVSHLLP